jgi:chromosomal replication initiator protein
MNEQTQSPASIWQTAYGELQLQIPRETFNTWLRNARLIAHEDGTFVIGVQNIYAREWLDQRLKKVIVRTLSHIAHRSVEVRFVLAPEHPKEQDDNLHTAGPLLAHIAKPTESPQFERLVPGETGVNPRQTFETYAVGACNRLAVAAAESIIEAPAAQFNPLYIYGGVGLGKSHILHAIGNTCAARGLSVLYVSAETFTNDLVASIRTRATDEFREKYRSTEILLMDDIQFLAGKETSQEEFLHTFNTLFNANAQVVLASNMAPGDLRQLDRRLRSRFEGGLIVELLPPDYLTRLDILDIKSDLRGFGDRITLNVLERIAEEVEGSARELEGALNRIIAASILTHTAPSLDHAETMLQETRSRHASSGLSLEDIIMTTAEYYGVSPEDLCGRSRSREVSAARQIAMYLAREEGDVPLQQIGEALGGRNHSTVLYSIERINDLVGTDSAVRRQVQAIVRILHPRNQPEKH